MSKGIVRIKPTPTGNHPGQLILTEADANGWRLGPGSPISFYSKTPDVKFGDIVECTFKSSSECDLGNIVGTATTAHGKVKSLPTERDKGVLIITTLPSPNPFNIALNAELTFVQPNNGWVVKVDDNVECFPIAEYACDIISVLVPA